MGNLIGLKNMIMFSAILLTFGSVSVQQAFAGGGCGCESQGSGDWNSVFDCGLGIAVPLSSDTVCIDNGDDVQLNGVGVANNLLISEEGSLLIGCEGDLTVQQRIFVNPQASLINHGSVDMDGLTINSDGLVQNSSSAFTFSFINNIGTFEDISTICDQPIGEQ